VQCAGSSFKACMLVSTFDFGHLSVFLVASCRKQLQSVYDCCSVRLGA